MRKYRLWAGDLQVEQMNTLLAQIYEQGQFHDNALAQKRGLREALQARGGCIDFDYLANDRDTLYQGFVNRMVMYRVDLVLTQFHSAEHLHPAQIRALKNAYPSVTWVNWSGDSWLHSLTSPPVLELAKEYDLWLVAAPDVLPVYEAEGIRAAFWQIGTEIPEPPLPEMPAYDVVFLGNVISEKRRALLELLRSFEGISVGIYGDWERSDGHNTYDFAAGESLYRNARLAIADAAYVDQRNYISNRPFQCLAAGGAMLLHQRVERMDVLSGLVAGVHYIQWNSLEELPAQIAFWLDGEMEFVRRDIVSEGQRFVLENHAYEARVRQLLDELLPAVQKERV